jgi:hypothetical protein
MIGKLGIVIAVLVSGALAYYASPARDEVIPASSGTFTMTSDPGDYVGQGLNYSYSVPAAALSVQNGGNLVRVDTSGADGPGDFWNLAFQAPAGQQLQAGMTYQAERWPFQPSTLAGLEVFGQGRGCNTLNGSFTILNIVYGPFGNLESFDATFEQHCEGATAALRREVSFGTPTPPPALALTVSAEATGTVSRTGAVTLGGTVACIQPVTVAITGTATQTPRSKKTASAQFTTSSSCTPAAEGTWQVTLKSSTAKAFAAGALNVALQAQATDPFYSAFIGATITAPTSASPASTSCGDSCCRAGCAGRETGSDWRHQSERNL